MTAVIGGDAADGPRRRFLIVAGLPKSGTTFLYEQFRARPDRFNLPGERKEIDYFRSGGDLGTYLNFFTTQDVEKTYLDASPLYIDDVETTGTRIAAALAGHEVTVVVCLRDPFERIYSHYLHDVAQNLSIFGHAAFGFWSPDVMAKYLYPLAGRVARLQEIFGAGNVFGFGFGSDNARLVERLRDVSGLEDDWNFSFDHNPAPGFTSPQIWFDPERETLVRVGGGLYLLKPRALLVVNRQFSMYRPEVSRELGDLLIRSQAHLTRSFDTGLLSEATRARVTDDMAQTAAALGIGDMAFPAAPQVFQSKVSDDLPETVLSKMRPVSTIDATIEALFSAPLRPSDEGILAMPGPASLSRKMAEINRQVLRRDPNPRPVPELVTELVEEFGPIPNYLENVVLSLILRRNFDRIEELLARYGGSAGRLYRPLWVARGLDRHKVALSDEEVARLEGMGVSTGRA